MKNKIVSFLKENGFLVSLFIGVCVVAAGTIYVSTADLRDARSAKNNTNNQEISEDIEVVEESETPVEEETDTEEVDNQGTVVEETIEEEVEEVAEVEEVPKEVVQEEVAKVKEAPQEEVVEVASQDPAPVEVKDETANFLPVEGEIITNYSSDKLVYSSTLEDWRFHKGIDIKASVGTDVKTPLSGTVKEVTEDDLWGISIVIDHGNGLETRYSNLGTKEMVKPGVSVNSGDVISVVGDTAKIEMDMDPHLHFEVIKNGKNIDPRSITKE